MTSPTARTLKALRDAGYMAAVVEKWNPHARVRADLFGWCDVIAVSDTGTAGIQACAGSSVAARVAKCQATPGLAVCLSAGWKCEVWGWAKRGARGKRKVWTLRKVDLATGEDICGNGAAGGATWS